MKKEKLKKINKNPSGEYFPKKSAWLIFDLSNGHKPNGRYVWWFDTKKQAYDWINDDAIELQYEISKPTKFINFKNINSLKLNNKKLKPEVKLTFGKYKGLTLQEVAKKNPGYVVWIHENTSYKVPSEYYKSCKETKLKNQISPIFYENMIYEEYDPIELF